MSDEAMLESQRSLAELGLFRRVRITELPRTGSLTRDVLVEIEEAATTTIDYGGGVEVGRIAASADDGSGAIDQLDIGPRGFFAISRRNLWGKNRSVTLFGRVTLRREADDPNDPELTRRATGSTTIAACSRSASRGRSAPPATGRSPPSSSRAAASSFSFNRRGVTTDYARRLGNFTVTGRYTFDYTKLFDEQIAAEDQLLIDRLFPQVKLSKIFGGILRDSRDDVLDPQRGAVVGVDGSVAARILGSEVGFVKTFAQGFVYRRLPGRGVVVAAGARLGLAVGFSQDIPPPLEIASVAARRPSSRRDSASRRSRRAVSRRRSRICRRASASSPAATPPCAASRSIASAPKRRSIRRASRRAATAWRSSISKRARRTGRTCSSCGSSTPATCSSAPATSVSTRCA